MREHPPEPMDALLTERAHTASEIATYLGIDPSLVYYYARRNKIHCDRSTRPYRFVVSPEFIAKFKRPVPGSNTQNGTTSGPDSLKPSWAWALRLRWIQLLDDPNRSRFVRWLGVLGAIASLIALIFVFYPFHQSSSVDEINRQMNAVLQTSALRALEENGYPPELYIWQHQLRTLKLLEPIDPERLDWISSHSLEELEIHCERKAESLRGLSSLARCSSLKKLTIDLSDSNVSNLDALQNLVGLKELNLNLSGNQQARDLGFLSKLSGLRQLTLDLSRSNITDVTPLASLADLAYLKIKLPPNVGSGLRPLAQLNNLTDLALDFSFSGSRDIDLTLLKNFEHLANLTLDLSLGIPAVLMAQATGDLTWVQIVDLTAVSKVRTLKQFSLVISGLQSLDDLLPLSKLSSASELNLDINRSEVIDLTALAKLPNLNRLNLAFGKADLRSLTTISNLTELDVAFNKVTDLAPLANLHHLKRLNLRNTDVSDLSPVEKLSNLVELDLRNTRVDDLVPLTRFPALTTISLRNTAADQFSVLARVAKLADLTLNLSDCRVYSLAALKQLKALRNLTINFENCKIADFGSIANVSGLEQLTLDLYRTEINGLEALAGLSNLRTISMMRFTRSQRMSLRRIPPGLVHLTI